MPNIIRWQTPTRYYAATIQKTLLGLSVLQCWGSRRDDLGNWKETPVESPEQAEAMMALIAKRRRQRHYTLVS